MVLHVKRTFIISALFALTVFVLLYKLGDVPLFDPDEPRYAESAREMIERGSIMVPYFNYEPRINKPVLYYWSICASYLAMGVSEFSARLPSACAAFALLLATFVFMKRFCGFSAAAYAALVLCSCPLFFVPGRLAMPDMLLGLFIALALFSFYLGWSEQEPARKKVRYFFFYFFQVGAAWIKGPVGILIPCAVAAFSLWREHDLRECTSLRPAWCLPAVLLASAPWYIYVYLHVDPSAMAEMSTKETVGRFFASGGHDFDPLYYYVIIVLPGLLPWSFFLPWALCKRFRMPESNRLRNFFEVWFVVVLVFFSLCAKKKPQYIIVLSCVFSAWLAIILQHAVPIKGDKRDSGFIASLFAILAVIIAGSCMGLFWISRNQPELLAGGIGLCLSLCLPSFAALLLAVRGYARTALVALSFVTFLSLVPALNQGLDWLEKHRSIKFFLQENNAVIAQAQEIVAGVKIFNGLPFYLRRRVVMETDKNFLLEKLQNPTPCIVFTSEKRFNRNKELFGKYLTVQKYKKVLLSNFAARGTSQEVLSQ